MQEETSELRAASSSNGRRITLDPLREKVLQVPWREVESTIPCGFRVGWIEGEVDGKEFDLCAGAGCGSPWVTFDYNGRAFCVDISNFVKALVEWEHETSNVAASVDTAPSDG